MSDDSVNSGRKTGRPKKGDPPRISYEEVDRLLVFGLALVVMMLVRPAGLFPSARRKAEMEPESEAIRVAENQQLYDIRRENEPALGERA